MLIENPRYHRALRLANLEGEMCTAVGRGRRGV